MAQTSGQPLLHIRERRELPVHTRRGARYGGTSLQPTQALGAALEPAAKTARRRRCSSSSRRCACWAQRAMGLTRAARRSSQRNRSRSHAETPARAASEASGEIRKRRQPLGGVGDDQLGGGRGRRCAHVGGEIGDGEVDFMPDAAHDGNRGCDDGPRQALIVECPQILERAAAAGEDEDVAFGAPAGEHGAPQ